MSAKSCGCDPDLNGGPYYCAGHRPTTTSPTLHFCRECYQQGGHTVFCSAWAGLGPVCGTTPRNAQRPLFPHDSQERKTYPIVTGVFDYFPDALAAVAQVSKAGNDQHNPGEPLHWAREKSTDQANCLGRHLLQRGTLDSDGLRHTAKMAWRALALLQVEIEAEQTRG